MTQKFQIFSNFQITSKNVSRHCGGHYNIKIKHFEHFSWVGSWSPPPCQVGLKNGIKTREMQKKM